MRIGAIEMTMTPYIYNTNRVSSLSMNKISAIPDDAAKGRTDYSGLVSDEAENENPLRRGQSRDFMGILTSQMSMSRYHQEKLMKNPETENMAAQDAQGAAAVQNSQDDMAYRMNKAIEAYGFSMGIA